MLTCPDWVAATGALRQRSLAQCAILESAVFKEPLARTENHISRTLEPEIRVVSCSAKDQPFAASSGDRGEIEVECKRRLQPKRQGVVVVDGLKKIVARRDVEVVVRD